MVIDISTHNGVIDFTKVKSQVKGVMIRVGYGSNGVELDVRFKRNVSECIKHNIDFGFYLYSYATSMESAKLEVSEYINIIKDYKPTLPVVIDTEDGIRGFIDEVRMTPDKIIIIDDKPGNRAYPSTINQVRAYCLAFKNMIGNDNRTIIAALRQRGTDNIFWSEEFNESNEQNIRYTINFLHRLIEDKRDPIPTKNPNKCRKCRFQSYCEEKAI